MPITFRVRGAHGALFTGSKMFTTFERAWVLTLFLKAPKSSLGSYGWPSSYGGVVSAAGAAFIIGAIIFLC